MLVILLIFVLTAASLALLFWVGGLFLQSYLYTQPSQGLHWQAPVAGTVLGGYIALWCMLIFYSSTAAPGDIPYDVLFRFSAIEYMGPEAVKELKVIPKKGGEPIVYKRYSVMPPPGARHKWKYENDAKILWDRNPQAILLTHNGEELRFAPVNPKDERFVSDKGGWVLDVDGNGTDGRPEAFRLYRLLFDVALNAIFVALWIGAVFLIRFLPSHAILFGIILWLVTSLTLLWTLFTYCADMSQKRRITQPTLRSAYLIRTPNHAAV